MSTLLYSYKPPSVCVCVSRKMIELLLCTGDNKAKDTKIDKLHLQLRETEGKCMWTHTNAMWLHTIAVWSYTNSMWSHTNAIWSHTNA